MTVSEWLDKKEAEGVDVSHIVLPDDLANDQDPPQSGTAHIACENIKTKGGV